MQSWARGAAGFVALAMALAIAAPAQADVVLKADNGFVVRNFVEVTASPVEVWRALIDPAKWWSNEHTFSGDAANLTLDPVAGGCFCERLPTSNPLAKDLPAGQREGGVQHMRVIYAEPLRAMVGKLSVVTALTPSPLTCASTAGLKAWSLTSTASPPSN